jgi:spore germination cell wall hydrolase CwlJ-like protein
MFWGPLATLIGTIRTQIMVQMETNSQVMRQGAAAVACFAAAAGAMPAIGIRAAEQRSDAAWGQRALAFHNDMLNGGASASAARLALNAAAVESVRVRALRGAPEVRQRAATIVTASLRDSAALASLRPFRPASLQLAKQNSLDKKCLAEAIYYEARGESEQGQMAVAEVVSNRVRSGLFPASYCGVVYQGSGRSTGCQFTFTCDGTLRRNRPAGEPWQEAQAVATQVMMGFARPMTNRATHYHTVEVDPVWSASLVETKRIGAHIFYRAPTRHERAAMTVQQEAALTTKAIGPLQPEA